MKLCWNRHPTWPPHGAFSFLLHPREKRDVATILCKHCEFSKISGHLAQARLESEDSSRANWKLENLSHTEENLRKFFQAKLKIRNRANVKDERHVSIRALLTVVKFSIEYRIFTSRVCKWSLHSED